MSAITNARSLKKQAVGRAVLSAILGLGLTTYAGTASADDPCPTDLPNPIYGSGGSAATATIGAVAKALSALPPEERVSVFYWDGGGACTGYSSFAETDLPTPLDPPPPKPVFFWYWTPESPAKGISCQPKGDEVLSFAHMGNTPALCPSKRPLPAGIGKFAAPVQTVNLITDKNSQYDSISAEAFYHVFGFGPGAVGHTVVPWTEPGAVYARSTSSFVHQFLATAFKVPPTAFKVPKENLPSQNDLTVTSVSAWGKTGDPSQSLGYVSGSAADKAEDAATGTIKTLAVQHYGQTCGYLPDSSRTRKDRLNVRNGQYALFTPGWFYAKANGGVITNPLVDKFVHWIDGSLPAPGGIDVVKIVIQAGDVPLCAMHANRPDGDFQPIVSFAPPNPCNGYFEFNAAGSTTLTACTGTGEGQCKTGAGEKCRYGYCELY